MGRKKKKAILSAKLISLLFVVSIVWLLTSLVIGLVKENLVEKQTLNYKHLKDVISTTGYLVREEEVVTAPNNGKLKKILNEGARVRINTVVAEVMTPSMETATGQANKKIKAPRAGLVSYRLDGLEKLFTLENWDKLKPKEVLDLTKEQQEGDAQVEQGKPLVKIVDNLALAYIYLQLNEKELGSIPFIEGDLIEFAITNKEGFQEGIRGKVTHFKNEEGYVQVLISNRRLSELALANRKLELEIIQNKYEGYVVPKDSLVLQDGKNGVYLVYKQVVRWVPVELVGTVGDKVAIKNVPERTSLSENMQIIVNHELVKVGQRVK